MIKVATVILTYNSKDYIKPCLEALFSFKGNFLLSVILIDNNSPDGTGQFIKSFLKSFQFHFPEFAKEFSEAKIQNSAQVLNFPKAIFLSSIKFIQNKENDGFAAGINIGINEALKENPDYIFLLNPDTKIQNDVITTLLNGILQYESDFKNIKVGITGAQMLFFNNIPQGTFGHFPTFFTEILQRTRLYKIFPFGRFIPYNFFTKRYFNKVLSVDWVSGGAMMIKREVIEKIGFFDENYFMYIEDIDFCRRVREAGFEIIYNPKAKIWHKLNASAEGAQTTIYKRQITNFINKIIKKIKNHTKIWQKESLAYYFKKWKSKLPEVVCRSTKYHLEPAGYTKIKFILNSIKTFLNLQLKSLRVLDIGCGNGNISFALAALKCNVTGVDIDDDLVERLKRKSKNLGISHLNFLKVDANNLNSLSNGKFDVIIMSEVLEHLKNPLKTLQDAKALLKEKGFIIITIPNKFSLEERLRQSINKSNFLIKFKNKLKSKINTQIQSSHDTPHLHFFSYNDFAKVIQKAGLYIKNAKAQSAGFKSFYYLLGKFILSRKSPLFHILDQIDGFLAQFIPAHFGDGMMFVISKSHRKLDEKYY